MAKKVSANGNGTGTPLASGRFPVEIQEDGTRVVTMPTGDRLTMQGVPPLILERLMNDTTGKPRVPNAEVTYAGGRRSTEPNPNDPAYLDALGEFNNERRMRLMLGLFSMGIRETPPDSFVDSMRDLFPEYGDKQMKYLWVAGMLTSDTDIGDFAELLTGQTLAVEADISGAMDTFRSSD